jgi:hypothetical protein
MKIRLFNEIMKILLVNAWRKLLSQTHQMRFALFHTFWSLIYRAEPATCLYTLVVYVKRSLALNILAPVF